MQTYESLKHTTWECKYHVVFIPKCRRKVLYHQIRRELGAGFRRLAERWEGKVEEGHLMPDHVHILQPSRWMAVRFGMSRSPARRTRIANQIRINIVSPSNTQKASRNIPSLFIAETPARGLTEKADPESPEVKL